MSEFITYRVAIDLALYIHEMEAQKLPEYSQQNRPQLAAVLTCQYLHTLLSVHADRRFLAAAGGGTDSSIPLEMSNSYVVKITMTI